MPAHIAGQRLSQFAHQFQLAILFHAQGRFVLKQVEVASLSDHFLDARHQSCGIVPESGDFRSLSQDL